MTDTWQQVTEQVGRALGRPDDAAALVDEVEGSLADGAVHPVAARHDRPALAEAAGM